MLVVVDGRVTLWSRQGKNLTNSFPELVAAALAHLRTAETIRKDFDGFQMWSITVTPPGVTPTSAVDDAPAEADAPTSGPGAEPAPADSPVPDTMKRDE